MRAWKISGAVTITALVCLGLLIPRTAKADTITFDGILSQPYSYGPVPENFDGYHWKNFSVFESTGCTGVKYEYTSTGYCRLTDATGITSQGYLFGRYGTTLLGTFSSDTPFTLESGIFAAAWNNDVVLTLTGYRNGQEVASGTYALNTGFDDCEPGAPPFCQTMSETFPFDLTFGFEDIDTVTFQGVGGHSDGVGSVLFPNDDQANVAIGNFTVQPYETPEPSTFGLFATGLVIAFGLICLNTANAFKTPLREESSSNDSRAAQSKRIDDLHSCPFNVLCFRGSQFFEHEMM